MAWQAHVWVKTAPNWKHNGNWEWANEWNDWVKRVWSTMGDWDLCLEVDASTPEELEDFVWNKLKTKSWVTQTHSTWSKQVWAAK